MFTQQLPLIIPLLSPTPSFLVPTSYYPLARSQYSTSSYYPPSSTSSSNANAISWYYPSNSSPSSTAGSAISLLRLCVSHIRPWCILYPLQDTPVEHHLYSCQAFGLAFGGAKEMSFVALMGNSLGLSASVCDSRFRVFAALSARRDSLISRLRLFKNMADDSDTYAMHRSQGLRRYTGWLFGEIDFIGVLDNEKGLCVRLRCPRDATCSAEALFVDQIEVLRETISVEEELEDGVLLESWFGSAFNTRVETKENTFWEILRTTGKRNKVLPIEASYHLVEAPLGSTLLHGSGKDKIKPGN
ncbi:hypothetical protein DFH09DRAFT_1071579 [Mycena vulgaris]|nr:hypothetical protein DFH09DRAFT_1071579 [Mycena vulgaris]